MLLKFRVANWKSIRDPLELSMYRAPTRSRGADHDNVARNERWDGKVSALAAIYGANAAGKSTLVEALRFFKQYVRSSFRDVERDIRAVRIPFFLDDSWKTPSRFEIEFRNESGVEYQYGFELSDEAVLSEYLYVYRTARRTVVFERSAGDETWYFGPSLKGPAHQIRETTRPATLFLSAGAAAGQEVLLDVFRWISGSLSVYSAPSQGREHQIIARRIAQDEQFRSQVLAFVINADLGVTDIAAVEDEPDPEIATLPEAEREKVKRRTYRLTLKHGKGKHSVQLPFAWESDGTKALISFAAVALEALQLGQTCVVDEIDTSLHPLLVAELVAVFADPSTNPRQAQLIFTTHDVSLLRSWAKNTRGIQKDQVWLVDKNDDGATELVSLIEYGRARPDENLARGYMTGRFGGVPSVAIAHALLATPDWEEFGDDAVVPIEP